MWPSRTRTAGVRRYAAILRDVSLRRWLASPPMIVALLLVACGSVTNTPAQDEAWRRWETCSSQVPGTDIRSVQLDGRIMFSANGPYQGRSMLDCLARVGTNGPALPEATYAVRSGGP